MIGSGQTSDQPTSTASSGEGTETLGQSVTRAVQDYLGAMEQQTVDDLYELVLTQVERPLLECAMRHTETTRAVQQNYSESVEARYARA